MFDDRFRRWIAPALRPPARALANAGVTANQVTVTGFVLAAVAAWAVAAGRPAAGMAFWLASRLLDAVDGAVAREAGALSGFGGYLDLTLDMAAYSLMAVAFGIVHPEHQLSWLLILMGYVLCITTTAVLSSILERRRASIPGNDRSIQFAPGFAEAGETTLVYLALAALPGWAGPIASAWVVVLLMTAVQRTLIARRWLPD